MKNIITLLGVITFISGCATMYDEPSSSSLHATLRGKPLQGMNNKILNYKEAYIYEINGDPVSDMWKSYGAKRKIPAGKNSVILGAHLGGKLTAISEVTFIAEENKDYQAGNNESKVKVTLYVEEIESGIMVGSSLADKTEKNEATTLYVPVVY